MKRFKVLFGNRRMMVLATLAVLVLAAAALIASSASFTAASANPGNLFTAGTLTMSNDKDTALIVTASNMKPGDTVSGQVTLSNTGSVPGTFTLTKALVGTDTAGFGGELRLTIQEYTDGTFTTPTGSTLFPTAALSNAISGLSLGVWQPSGATKTHYYKFTVNWPNDAGAPADDTFQGKSVTYRFDWNATS